MQIWRRSVRAASLAAMLLATGAGSYACTSNPPPAAKEPEKCKFQVVNMTILAGQRLNPTEFGEARPVQLRLYQMKSDARFNFAEFQDIWKEEKKTLGDDLLSSQELSIYPESRTEVRFERDESALNVVAVALFRNPTGRTWWTSFDLPPPPGKGDCAATCADGSCDGGTPLNPQFTIYMDGTRIDDGEDHLDDYPDGKWPRMVNAKLSPKKAEEKGGSP